MSAARQIGGVPAEVAGSLSGSRLATDPAVIADAIAVISARHASAVLAAGRGSALYLDPFVGALIWGTAADAAAVTVIATHADVARVLAALQAERRGDANFLEPDDVSSAVAADARHRLGVEAHQRAFEAEVDAELACMDAASERKLRVLDALSAAQAVSDILDELLWQELERFAPTSASPLESATRAADLAEAERVLWESDVVDVLGGYRTRGTDIAAVLGVKIFAGPSTDAEVAAAAASGAVARLRSSVQRSQAQRAAKTQKTPVSAGDGGSGGLLRWKLTSRFC